MAMHRWQVMALCALALLAGCQPTRESVVARSPQELRWLNAILQDAKRPLRYQSLLRQGGNSSQLPVPVEVYRPHPEFIQITEQDIALCKSELGGQEKPCLPNLFVNADIRGIWDPSHQAFMVAPRLPDIHGCARVERLFRKNVRLRALRREKWQGRTWQVVEAHVPGGYARYQFWIAEQGDPLIRRIQVQDPWGRLMWEEERTRIDPLPESSSPPALPQLPEGWKQVLAYQTKEPPQEVLNQLKRFVPPKRYELITSVYRSCDVPHHEGEDYDLVALFSNGLDSFTLILLSPTCARGDSIPIETRVGSDYRGVIALKRNAQRWSAIIVGEIDPALAHSALERWGRGG